MRLKTSNLLIVTSFLVGTTVTQKASGQNAGEGFASVQAEFEANLQIIEDAARDGGGYNKKDVNTALTHAKEGILAKIPPADVPLRSYAERRLPDPVESASGTVSKTEAQSKFAVLKELLARLSTLKTLQVDLEINTRPREALFELVPTVGTPVSTRTNDRLTNVYRGEYVYNVSKAGYKPIHFTINFIDRAGDTLDCELLPDSDPQPALPCQLR